MDINEFQDPDFRAFRQYDKLVRRGLAKPIVCKVDHTVLTTMLDKDDILILKCFYCGSIVKPGQNLLDAVKEIVEEKL
jgi:hypothetical protein